MTEESKITVGQERLRTLYAMMAGVPDSRVKLYSWRADSTNSDGALLHDCNSHACAVGWACAYPEFIQQGLEWTGCPTFTSGARQSHGFAAVEDFFDLTAAEAEALFQPHGVGWTMYREAPTCHHVQSGEHDLTKKQQVMRRIRRFLMSQGVISPERNAELAKEEGVLP